MPPAPHRSHRPLWPHALASAACLATPALADDIHWGNVNGGSFHLATNWIGGAVPGPNDRVHFSRTRDPDQQAAYTITFSASPSNQYLAVERDRVTLDLNGNAYNLLNPTTAMRIGDWATVTARLTILDGIVATPPDSAVIIGPTLNAAGVLTLSTGAQLFGPSLRVSGGAAGTLNIQNGADLVGGPMFVGSDLSPNIPGVVSVSGTGSTMVIEDLTVGRFGPGTVNINSAARVESTTGALGSADPGLGTVNVDGTNSRWTLSGDLAVGAVSQGVLNIAGGARVQGTRAFVGQNPTGSGSVSIDGPTSIWTNSTDVSIGDRGQGTLNISRGGRLQCFQAIAGHLPASTGVITVSGASTLFADGQCVVGGSGQGAMIITDGGIVQAPRAYIGFDTVPATVIIDGAGSGLVCYSDIFVGYASSNAALTITASGVAVCTNASISRFQGVGSATVTGAGSRFSILENLALGGAFDQVTRGGAGSLSIGDGALVTAGQMFLYPQGSIELRGGTLSTSYISRITTGEGRLSLLSGVLHADAISFDVQNLGATIAPGREAGEVELMSIAGSYTQGSAASLEIDMTAGGTATSPDSLQVGGAATLGGRLALRFLGRVTPRPDETIEILDAASITGSFSNAASGQRLTVPGGGSFIVNYGPGSPFDPTTVVLSNYDPCLADFNADGFIDFFDYDDFVTCFETAACPPGRTADFNGDDFIDFFDYDDFVAAFEAGC